MLVRLNFPPHWRGYMNSSFSTELSLWPFVIYWVQLDGFRVKRSWLLDLNLFHTRSHTCIAFLSWSKGRRVLGILDSITKGMPKVARSQGHQSWGRGFFSQATKFSSLSLEEMRGLQERDCHCDGEGTLPMIYIASRNPSSTHHRRRLENEVQSVRRHRRHGIGHGVEDEGVELLVLAMSVSRAPLVMILLLSSFHLWSQSSRYDGD